ncbi:MAG: TPM domain-containing protein [Bacilli bacterium]|nr:TPM domain-containing protein [Bacilli bacterium]
MKRTIRIGFIIFLGFLYNICLVSASTNTNIRTESDYRVEDWVEITESNKRHILNTPSVNEEEKIYDFANLYTESEEHDLFNKVSNYINSYNMDLVIVTITSNNKASPMTYADDFYDYNKFGIGQDRAGVLFLIDMENREIYMSTTGNAINMYNDYRINESLEKVYQYMSNEEYFEGTSNYIKVISDYASSGLPSNNDSNQKMPVRVVILRSLLSGLIITIIIMIILIRKNKLVRKATTAEEYLDQDSVDIKTISDSLISTNTVRTTIEHDTSSGSSTHSGSSGSSHGGGGHGF